MWALPTPFQGKDYKAPSSAGWAAGRRATVSSVFIWAALKDAGITLEGHRQEPEDRRQGVDIDSCTPLPEDGLYCYSAEQRLKAGDRISSTDTLMSLPGYRSEVVLEAAVPDKEGAVANRPIARQAVAHCSLGPP